MSRVALCTCIPARYCVSALALTTMVRLYHPGTLMAPSFEITTPLHSLYCHDASPTHKSVHNHAHTLSHRLSIRRPIGTLPSIPGA
jgi:hypothetical protein